METLFTFRPSVDGREVVRCETCRIVQFKGERCRKCKRLFVEVFITELSPPVPPSVQRRSPATIISTAKIDIGYACWLLRKAKELSQPELGRRMGIPRTYISKVENHKTLPTIPQLQRLANALEVPVIAMILIATAPRHDGDEHEATDHDSATDCSSTSTSNVP